MTTKRRRRKSSVDVVLELREERKRAEKGVVKTGWGIALL
jgi:hypothetical protein